jgi:hypothetical protein
MDITFCDGCKKVTQGGALKIYSRLGGDFSIKNFCKTCAKEFAPLLEKFDAQYRAKTVKLSV